MIYVMNYNYQLQYGTYIGATRVNFFLGGGGLEQIQCVFILFMKYATLIISEIILFLGG